MCPSAKGVLPKEKLFLCQHHLGDSFSAPYENASLASDTLSNSHPLVSLRPPFILKGIGGGECIDLAFSSFMGFLLKITFLPSALIYLALFN